MRTAFARPPILLAPAHTAGAFSGRLAAVSKKLVRRGRVCGYRPTHARLEEMLELAQRGIDDTNVNAHLSYWQGDQQISPQDSMHKVLPRNLDEIIKEADPETRELSNLSFDISQDGPVERAVVIQIGPDQWTTYEVRSDDQTWAIGRYYELTNKLLNDRNLYSKAYSARPQVPQKGAQGSWKPGTWEVVDDLRVSLVKLAVWLSLWAAPIAAAIFAFFADSWYYPGGKTYADLMDHQNALNMLHWANVNQSTIILISLSYLLWLISGRLYWLKSWRKSAVVLKKSAILSQFSFTASGQNSVAIATFYATVVAVILAIITILKLFDKARARPGTYQEAGEEVGDPEVAFSSGSCAFLRARNFSN